MGHSTFYGTVGSKSARLRTARPSHFYGRLTLNMLATRAEYERELIVERVNTGIAAARRIGTRFAGRFQTLPSLRTNLQSPVMPGSGDGPRKTLPAASAGVAPPSTATNKSTPPAKPWP